MEDDSFQCETQYYKKPHFRRLALFKMIQCLVVILVRNVRKFVIGILHWKQTMSCDKKMVWWWHGLTENVVYFMHWISHCHDVLPYPRYQPTRMGYGDVLLCYLSRGPESKLDGYGKVCLPLSPLVTGQTSFKPTVHGWWVSSYPVQPRVILGVRIDDCNASLSSST